MSFGAIILAAGASSRMGGETKQLAKLNGKALVSHVAEAALGAALDPIIVVLGHEADKVRAALADDVNGDRVLLPVASPRYKEGMAESLKVGAAALPDDIDGAFILLADMPFVTAGLLAQIRAGFTPDKFAAAPVWNGQRGNPVLLSPRALGMIANLSGDRGLGPILNQRADEIVLVSASDDACLRDIDTPEALKDARGG